MIRKFEKNDIDEVMQIWENENIGLNTNYIEGIFVDANKQSNGIGSSLLNKAKEEHNIEKLQYKIKFIQKQDVIEEVIGGHSGALVYKITRNNEKFFLKIFNSKLDKEKIMKIKAHTEIYKKLNIKSLKIIDYGEIENIDKYYIVYNFIEGINLHEYTSSDKFTLEDIRKIGEKIGKELLKLKKYKNYDKNLFKNNDIKESNEEIVNNFNSLLEDETAKKIITQYFKIEEIEELKNIINEYIKIFENKEQNLIHGDTKRANIMIDSNDDMYIVDIEAMQVNYDIRNIKYQITWALFEGHEKEAEFLKGYFDGIYNNTRPIDFNKQIIFITITNFFNSSYSQYKKGNVDKLTEYIKKCRELFDRIRKIDIEKEFII